MILNDYDVITNESQLAVLDYVIESAKFEIANGNDSYIAVYEAATDSANKSNENWFVKIAGKIKMFAKSAIAKLKMLLNQLATKFRTRKAVKIQKKLTSGKFNNKSVSGEKNSADITTAVSTMNSYENALNTNTASACMKFVDSIRNGSVPKSIDEFKTSYMGIGKAAGSVPNELQFADTKKYIDNAVKYLTNLSNSTSDIKKCNETLKQSGKSASEIRYGISTMYNFLTAVVKEYYENAMKISKYFMSNGADVQKTAATSKDKESTKETAENITKTFEELKKMNEQFANKLDINTDELDKIASEYEKYMKEEASKRERVEREEKARFARPGATSIPQHAHSGYSDEVRFGLKAIDRYLSRVKDVFYKKLRSASSKDEIDSIRQILNSAKSQSISLVHRELDGKMSEDVIDSIIDSINRNNFGEIEYNAKFNEDEFNSGIYNNPKEAASDISSLADIRRFFKTAKRFSPEAKAAVKEKGIAVCNKAIRNLRKKYGSNPNVDDMQYRDANTYENAFELRKQLKDL